MAGAMVVGPTRLQWNDGSQIELLADGAARVLDNGKGLFLDHGFLEADIATQKSGTQFLVRSAQSVTKVIGTHFSLRCEDDATTLRVREGRVVFIAQSGEEQLVTTGGSAVAFSPGRATSTPLLSTPAPSTAAKPTRLLAPSDLVGWWPLDEGSGTVAHDRSGHGHDGQIHGAQWTAHGLQFNGGDDRVDMAPNGALAGVQGENYAICAWFRPALLPATLDRHDARASRDRISMIAGRTGWHIGLYLDDLGQFAMQHHLVGDVPSSAVSAPVAIPEQWYHLVGMVDRIHGETRLMVNGIQTARAAWTPGAVAGEYTADQPWHIGIGEADSPEFRWSTKGLIREVRCYARTLSDVEITRLAEPTSQP